MLPEQDIALVERAAATFDAAQRPGSARQNGDAEPQHCVLLRAGGHMSVLDMEQGNIPLPDIIPNTLRTSLCFVSRDMLASTERQCPQTKERWRGKVACEAK